MKRVFLLLGVCFFFGVAIAETIVENSFQDLGFAGFENSEANATQCQTFPLFKDLTQNTEDFYTVVSLHVLFEPVPSEDANITVFLNDIQEPIASAHAMEFLENWFRVKLPNETLWEENILEICLTNSNTTAKTTFLADSLYGAYTMAEFKENDFVKTISTKNPPWNQEFSVTVELHNSGSETVDVNVLYRKPVIEFKHIPFVKGETSFVGSIPPNESISFSYSIKATETGPFALPAAIVFFENEFGEKKQLVSNYPRIEVLEPDIKIHGIVLNKTMEKRVLVGKAIPVQAIITNKGVNEISNIAIIFPSTPGLQFSQETHSISSLKSGESTVLELLVTPLEAGWFEVGCNIAYLDLELEDSFCDSTSFLVEEDFFPIEWIGGIVLIIIAILVYVYYHFR
ncbi:hypothetical protein KKE06_05985 [Candidatus Micrarchaeota archaeon]|nr:hypothetical protein [Candidatus Micrarchaeota archaeon]MBU1930424.1 hypothetical protein [Candidatus Micrarchaeota archaeon]